MLFKSLFFSVSSGLVMHGGSVHDFEQQIKDIDQSVESDSSAKSRAISALYSLRVLPLQVAKAKLSDGDLHSVFAITDMAWFYSGIGGFGNPAVFLRHMEDDLAEMERRGTATDAEVTTTYESLVAGRSFDRALELRNRYPKLALRDVPSIKRPPAFDEKAPAALSLSGDGKSLVLSNINMAGDTFIVVVAGCHFARDATAAIKADPELAAAFRKGHAVWIGNAHDPLSLQDLRDWNDVFPDQPLSIAYDNGAWRQVDFSSQPALFFFKDGKLVSERRGWSAKNSKPAWRDSLRELGLLK